MIGAWFAAIALSQGAPEPASPEPDASIEVVVFEELLSLARTAELGALVATHNDALAARMDRVVRLVDGVLIAG